MTNVNMYTTAPTVKPAIIHGSSSESINKNYYLI